MEEDFEPADDTEGCVSNGSKSINDGAEEEEVVNAGGATGAGRWIAGAVVALKLLEGVLVVEDARDDGAEEATATTAAALLDTDPV